MPEQNDGGDAFRIVSEHLASTIFRVLKASGNEQQFAGIYLDGIVVGGEVRGPQVLGKRVRKVFVLCVRFRELLVSNPRHVDERDRDLEFKNGVGKFLLAQVTI